MIGRNSLRREWKIESIHRERSVPGVSPYLFLWAAAPTPQRHNRLSLLKFVLIDKLKRTGMSFRRCGLRKWTRWRRDTGRLKGIRRRTKTKGNPKEEREANPWLEECPVSSSLLLAHHYTSLIGAILVCFLSYLVPPLLIVFPACSSLLSLALHLSTEPVEGQRELAQMRLVKQTVDDDPHALSVEACPLCLCVERKKNLLVNDLCNHRYTFVPSSLSWSRFHPFYKNKGSLTNYHHHYDHNVR